MRVMPSNPVDYSQMPNSPVGREAIYGGPLLRQRLPRASTLPNVRAPFGDSTMRVMPSAPVGYTQMPNSPVARDPIYGGPPLPRSLPRASTLPYVRSPFGDSVAPGDQQTPGIPGIPIPVVSPGGPLPAIPGVNVNLQTSPPPQEESKILGMSPAVAAVVGVGVVAAIFFMMRK